MHVKSPAEWAGERSELLAELRAFAETMRNAPFQNQAGLRGVSAFALFWFLRRVRPTIVFEVGVWKGFSTWLIEQAAPKAEIHAFDPMFQLADYLDADKVGPVYRSARASYSSQDFSCAPVRALAAPHKRPLAFFDDHQNKMPRLLQCRAAGIRDIVFDDNMTGNGTHRSLEEERADLKGRELLDLQVETYQVFPALWPVSHRIGGLVIEEKGMGFPVEPPLRHLHDERLWHSYVTYVRLSETD